MSQASEQDGTPLPGTDAEWKQRLTPEQYTDPTTQGYRAGFHRQVLAHQGEGSVPVRRLRPAAFLLGRQIRLGHGMAQFLDSVCPQYRSDRIGR